MISIHNPQRFAELLWPQFTAIDDAVFLNGEFDAATMTQEHVRELAATDIGLQMEELTVNHVHIFEFIDHKKIPIIGESPFDEYDATHPDFEIAWLIAKQMVLAWRAKLALDYPDRSFVVFATKLSDPIVRFYCRRSSDVYDDLDEYFGGSINADEAFVQCSPPW